MNLFTSLTKVFAEDVETDEEKPRFCAHIERVLLCINCEVVFEVGGNQKCPSCGSKVAWSIARALNRERED